MKITAQEHGKQADAKRPRGGICLWIGSATPQKARAGDIWLDTSDGAVKRVDGLR